MNGRLIISRPYIRESQSDVFQRSIRLCADVIQNNEKRVCYFEFDKVYEDYLCDEISDAFVVGLLATAMNSSLDIEFDAPISEDLYYNLTEHYIPTLARYNKDLHGIKLIGSITNKSIENKGAVATGCSGGVDSFYTIKRHLDESIPSKYKLTHLIYNSVVMTNYRMDAVDEELRNQFAHTKKICDDCGLTLVACKCNLREFLEHPFESFCAVMQYAAVPMAIQKLISIYYHSSGFLITDFDISAHSDDISSYDTYSLSCFSTNNIRFYSIGYGVLRSEKLMELSNYQPARDNLFVCMTGGDGGGNKSGFLNCCNCHKCLRTITELYCMGKLHDFNRVFDIDSFIKHKSRKIGKTMALDNDIIRKHLREPSFGQLASSHGVNIRATAYIWYLLYKVLYSMMKLLRRSSWLRTLYYKYNLDYRIRGYRSDRYYYYTRDKQ